MRLDPDFKEFVERFTANEVRFLIVGGYAVAAHGLPRYTGDFDAWIWVSPDNATRVLRALNEFGFGSLGLTEADFNQENQVVQLGFPPHRIDILTSIDGVDFESAWRRRMTIELDGGPLSFIGLEDLLTNKRAVGRPQDLADVERLTHRTDE